MPVPFVGPSYTLALRKAAIDDAVNCYLVGMEALGKAPFVMFEVPGYSLFAALGSPIRGCLTTNDRTFFVAGTGLYEVSANGAFVSRGTLATSSGAVEIAYGTSQLVIVDGANGYVLTLATNVFQQITSPGFYGSNTVTFLDNYFHFVRPNSGQFYISAINDATTLSALDFATAESQPDNLIATIAVQRRLLLLGGVSTEIWFDSGNVDFPFEREGTTIEIGCIAPHSARVVDNTAFMVGRDKNGGGIVYRLQGYQWLRISTQAIEQALQLSTNLTQAVGYAYQENGLTFYAINAPGLTRTWVYEVASGAWHTRADLDSVGQFKADRGVCHTYAFDYHLIGGSDGNVYRLDSTVSTKAGDPLVVQRTSPHNAVPNLKDQFFSAFHLDCSTGQAPQGVDPRVYLYVSKNSGATWDNGRGKSIGKVGQRFERVTWRPPGGLAHGRDVVFRIKFSDNAPFAIVSGTPEMEEGRY